MIIASPIISLRRMAENCRKSYARRNSAYESCNGVKPSAKIKAKNALKAIGASIAAEAANSTIV